MSAATDALRRTVLEDLRLAEVQEAAQDDPKPLLAEIRGFDPTLQEWFGFAMYPQGEDPYWGPAWEKPEPRGDPGWYWQAPEIIDWFHDPEIKKYLILKARQLGITWLACAYGLWLMLYRPGSKIVAYSYTEDEAKKLVARTWLMYQTIPLCLRSHVKVISPMRAEEPSEWIKLKHPDARISSFQALPATKKHGHGDTVTFAIMDEVARQDYARQIYTAINPATSRLKKAQSASGRLTRGGKLAMISTANGVSNSETGEGNFFHHLWVTKEEKGLAAKFLPWNLHPERDEAWYQAEAMALDEVERNQQYPLNEDDAFMLSGHIFFDRDSMAWYRENIAPTIVRGQFVVSSRRRANFMPLRDGVIEVYEKPRPDGEYAIGVDTATGRGTDYTSCDVIDLSSGAICAHFHAKMEVPRAAIQLHYLGKWYNTAKICVERQGGYGDALIYALRDGNQNLPAYTNLYRHKKFVHGDKPLSEEYGHPMGPNARATVLDGLKTWIRERLFPWLGHGTVDELGHFVYADTIPSPRAMDGCNDDRVMSLALAAEMYRQFGQLPTRTRKFKKAPYVPPPTRQTR